MRRRRALGLGAALALVACQSEGRAPPAAVAPPAPPPPARPAAVDVTAEQFDPGPLPRTRLTLAGKLLDVEVAATRDARTRGLMWRTVLPEGTGMLFVFPEEDWLSFWMKNTLIPLDMIFIGADLTVVGIVERAEPKTLTSRGPQAMARYVLEVPGGWSEKFHARPGLKVQIDGLERFAPRE